MAEGGSPDEDPAVLSLDHAVIFAGELGASKSHASGNHHDPAFEESLTAYYQQPRWLATLPKTCGAFLNPERPQLGATPPL